MLGIEKSNRKYRKKIVAPTFLTEYWAKETVKGIGISYFCRCLEIRG